MAYIPPGTLVKQVFTPAAATPTTAKLPVAIVGPAWDVYDDEVCASAYDAHPSASTQDFLWPSKISTSIVDLAGVNSTSERFDDQMIEFADYPVAIALKGADGTETSVDNSYVTSIDQAGFTLAAEIVAPKFEGTGCMPVLNNIYSH